MIDQYQFSKYTDMLMDGILREVLGFSIENKIPFYRGILGYMVEVPLLWIRHSRFPILFIAYDHYRPDILLDVVKQLGIAKATEFFALLIVVPLSGGTGNEAEELRHIVNNSVYRHDFLVLDREHLASIIVQNGTHRLVEIILEQDIELSTLSPYVVKGPVPANMFFGREKEIKVISQSMLQMNYALVGGRRIGKSSILQRINSLLSNDPRYQTYYLNCEDSFNRSDFTSLLGTWFSQTIDADPQVPFRSLVNSLRVASNERHIVFLMDEIDGLLDFDANHTPPGQLFKSFRALAHEHMCSFVFSGSKTLYNHLHNAKSPFFNFCNELVLTPLTEQSVVEIVSKPMQQLGIDLQDEEKLIDEIIALTSCHPSLVQWVCRELLNTIVDKQIAVDDLERVASNPDFHRFFIETAWSDATAFEKLVSVSIDAKEFVLDDICNAMKSYGITDRSRISQALDVLHLYSLLKRQGKQYRFVLSHYPQIIRQAEDIPSLVDSWLRQLEE